MASDPTRPEAADAGASPGRSDHGHDTEASGGTPERSRSEASRAARRHRRSSTVGRLDLGDAIHDGWQAFCRAPRVFAGFTLLVNLLLLALQPLMAGIGTRANPSSNPLAWLLFLLALVTMVALNLWAQLSLGQAARLALNGARPTLAQLLRTDRAASLRLLRAWLRLAALVVPPFAIALVLFGLPLLLLWETSVQNALGLATVRLLGLILAALLLVSLALSLAAVVYLVVNQVFLLQIVLLEGRGGAAAVERGRQLVDPQWPLVLLLVIVTGLLSGLGLLVCMVGGLVAWPAVICITTAAYQQLRDSEVRREAAAAQLPPGPGSAAHP